MSEAQAPLFADPAVNYENLQTGYVRLYRSLERNPVWNQHPAEYLKVWIACLMRANYKPSRWYTPKGEVEIPRGSFICSAEKLALALNVNRSTLRRALRALEVHHMIDQQTTKTYTMITVCNYDTYNSFAAATDHQTDQDATRIRPTNDQDATRMRPGCDQPATTTNKERSKEGKNTDSCRTKFDEFWSIVWAKIGKDAAWQVWQRKVKTVEMAVRVIAEAKRQGPRLLSEAAAGDRTPVHPRTWLSQGRYEDELPAMQPRLVGVPIVNEPEKFKTAEEWRDDAEFFRGIGREEDAQRCEQRAEEIEGAEPVGMKASEVQWK